MYLCKGGNGKGKDAEAVIKLSGKHTKVQLLTSIHNCEPICGYEGDFHKVRKNSAVTEWNLSTSIREPYH